MIPGIAVLGIRCFMLCFSNLEEADWLLEDSSGIFAGSSTPAIRSGGSVAIFIVAARRLLIGVVIGLLLLLLLALSICSGV